MRAGVLCILAVFGAAAASGQAFAQGPSFDCAKAQTPDERAICADPRLAELDALMAKAYGQARRKNAGRSRAAARDYLGRRGTCGGAAECITRETVAVIDTYRALGATVEAPAWAKPVPGWAGGPPPGAAAPSGAAPPPGAPAAAPPGAALGLSPLAGAAGQAAAALAPPAFQQALLGVEPPNWSGACKVEQKVGGVWNIRVDESFGTIRVSMDYSAPDRLPLRARDGSRAEAVVAPYSYSASVNAAGTPEAVAPQWFYEQVFLTVDPRGADVDPATPIDVRLGDQMGKYRLGSPTPLDPGIAEEIGRSVHEIALSSSEGEVVYPMDLQPYETARRQMKLLVDEVVAKQLKGECFS
jgi:uncharacterized protein YecT (DUF1311 family)